MRRSGNTRKLVRRAILADETFRPIVLGTLQTRLPWAHRYPSGYGALPDLEAAAETCDLLRRAGAEWLLGEELQCREQSTDGSFAAGTRRRE